MKEIREIKENYNGTEIFYHIQQQILISLMEKFCHYIYKQQLRSSFRKVI